MTPPTWAGLSEAILCGGEVWPESSPYSYFQSFTDNLQDLGHYQDISFRRRWYEEHMQRPVAWSFPQMVPRALFSGRRPILSNTAVSHDLQVHWVTAYHSAMCSSSCRAIAYLFSKVQATGSWPFMATTAVSLMPSLQHMWTSDGPVGLRRVLHFVHHIFRCHASKVHCVS